MSTRSAFATALVSFIGAAAALTAAAPAPAAMPGPVAVAAVPTGDLDLASAQGQATLKLRLQHAAADVCGDASSADPAGHRWVRTCRTEAFDKAWTRALAGIGSAERLATR